MQLVLHILKDILDHIRRRIGRSRDRPNLRRIRTRLPSFGGR